MKIYISNMEAQSVTHPDILDIPLAYLNSFDMNYEVNIVTNEDFVGSPSKILLPYQDINDPDTLFFDENGNVRTDIILRRYGNRYVYEPQNMTEFTPTRFKAAVLIQRKMTYSTAKNYDISVAVAETDSDIPFSKELIKIFGDANKRGIAPSNVTINNGATDPWSLINKTIDSSDFIFVKSDDGTDLSGLDIEDAIKRHANVWISAANFGTMIENAPNGHSFMQEGHLNSFYKATSRKKNPPRIFNGNKEFPSFTKMIYDYELLYDDVLVIGKNNEGFIIVTPSEFLEENIADNTKIIYDVMLKVFLNAYAQSAWGESWITDSPVDYMAYTRSKINAYHEQINLDTLLKNSRYDLDGQYNVLDIIIDTSKVTFIRFGDNNDMFFMKKKQKEVDPEKKENQISCLTTKGTIVICNAEEKQLIEDTIEITPTVNGSSAYITIAPYRSSSKHIWTEEQELSILDNNEKYFLCVKPRDMGLKSEFSLVPISDYGILEDGLVAASISVAVSQKEDSINAKIYDIRMPGGGVPVNDKDDYNMADIGNSYGRPYRIGSTLIITLPEKCKQYEDRILKAINQHISAGEYPIIIYKKEREDA